MMITKNFAVEAIRGLACVGKIRIGGRGVIGWLPRGQGLGAEQAGEQVLLNSCVGLSRSLGSDVLANLATPRLVLVGEPDQLRSNACTSRWSRSSTRRARRSRPPYHRR